MTTENNTKIWICEKPSQAESLANAIGKISKENGYFQTNQGLVTWCFGHMFQLAPPEHYDPSLEFWSASKLPVLPSPSAWHLNPSKDAAKQLSIIKKLFGDASEVVIATDGDREGEAIGRNVINEFNFKGKITRLWLSALDPVSIDRALAKIKDGSETLNLFHAAQARSRADWLIGMNGTMAATTLLASGGVVSLGRVQTPTLAMIVRRDHQIENFLSKDFYEFSGQFTIDGKAIKLTYSPQSKPEDKRIYSKDLALDIARKIEGENAKLDVECKRKKIAPPKLFSLSGLQMEANKKWGWSADQTLDIAQALYETHKVTTYPRTDCPYLPEEQIDDVKPILEHLKCINDFNIHIQGINKVGENIRKTVFNTKKVTAHHAIIPTQKAANIDALNADERKAYMLIATHFITCLMPDFEYDETTITTTVMDCDFKATYPFSKVQGWCALIPSTKKDASELPLVENGSKGIFSAVTIEEKSTSAPSHYTEATLLSDMTNVAKYVEDPAFKAVLKETSGIGTEATRASVIKTLKTRGVITVKGKALTATDSGKALIKALPESASSPAVTAIWEDQLNDVANGKMTQSSFMDGIEKSVGKLLSDIQAASNDGARVANGKEKKPSDGMLATIRNLIKITGDECDKGFENDTVLCRKYLDKHTIAHQEMIRKPSAKAVEYAVTISKTLGLDLPEEIADSRESCSAFIEKHKGSMPSREPTEPQLKLAERIAKHIKVELTDEQKVSMKECSAFIDENIKKLPKKKTGSRKGRRKTSKRVAA